MGSDFAKLHGFNEEIFEKAALISKNPAAFESLKQLNEEDKVCSR